MKQDLPYYIHLSVAEAQSQLAEIVGRVSAEDRRVILSKNGEDVAAIISLEAFWFLEKMIELAGDEVDAEDSLSSLAEALQAELE